MAIPAGRRKKGPLVFPQKPSAPSDNVGDYFILLYGREKVGKTSFCAQFDDTLFLMFEPGGKALEIYQMPVPDWGTFKRIVDSLPEQDQFRTIVVDTVDLAYKACEDAKCRELGVTHPSEAEWGKGWQTVRDEFSRVMTKLLNLGKGVVAISHEDEKDMESKRGKQTRIVPSMGKQARRVIEPMVDVWIYYGLNGKDRELQVRGDDMISAGHRLRHRLVGWETIPAGNSPEEAYSNFLHAWNNEAPKGEEPKRKVTLKKRN